uniref:Uncharacterized protein n=1 Tax=Arundo donax TaxID=35708 RepID=A0A0A8Y1D3_ARUDO
MKPITNLTSDAATELAHTSCCLLVFLYQIICCLLHIFC